MLPRVPASCCPVYYDIPGETLPDGSFVNVCVFYATSPSDFYVNLASEGPNLSG
jgi:hypothetical protein